MIDVKSTRCSGGCSKYPSCNYPGELKRLYCKDCKLPGMVDVKNKRCAGGCGKYPNYNFPNKSKRLYCKKCKLSGMFRK
eukprot:Pgem_evm1s4551